MYQASAATFINGFGLFIRFLTIIIFQRFFSDEDFSIIMYVIHAINLSTYFGSLEIHTFLSRLYAGDDYSPRTKKILKIGHERSLISRAFLTGFFYLILLSLIGIDKFNSWIILIGFFAAILDLPFLEQTRVWVIEKKVLLGVFVTISRYAAWSIIAILFLFLNESLLTINNIITLIFISTALHYILIFNSNWTFSFRGIFNSPLVFPYKIFRRSITYFWIASISNLFPYIERIVFLRLENYQLSAAFTYHLSFASITAVFLSTFFVTANQGMFVSDPNFSKNVWFKQNIFKMIFVTISAMALTILVFELVQIFSTNENPFITSKYLFLICISTAISSVSGIPWMIAYAQKMDSKLLNIILLKLLINLVLLFFAIELNNYYFIFLSQLPGNIVAILLMIRLSKVKIL